MAFRSTVGFLVLVTAGLTFTLTFDVATSSPLPGHWVGQLYVSPRLFGALGSVTSGGLLKRNLEPGFDGGDYDLTVTLDGGTLGLNGSFAFQDFTGEVKFSGSVIQYTLPRPGAFLFRPRWVHWSC